MNQIYNQKLFTESCSTVRLLHPWPSANDDPKTRVWLITGTSSGLGRALVKSVLDKRDKIVANIQPTISSNNLL